MTLLDGDWLSGPLGQRLTWTLLHFCWQGIAVAALVAVWLRVFRPVRAETRYAMCLVGLALMVAVPAATFLAIPLPPPRVATLPVEEPANVAPVGLPVDDLPTDEPAGQMTIMEDSSAQAVEMPTGPEPIEGPTLAEQFAGLLHDGQPYLLVAWTLGVFLLGSRLLVGYAGVQLLRRRREPLSEAFGVRIAELGRRMGLAGCPPVFASRMARVAMAVGFFRPVVLVPAAWLLEMSPEVLEAVIAHELAHLRRWDLWVNLMQRLAETLFFYHPAVWWLSRRIRLEREMCCDAAAVEATGQRVDYLRALEWVARQRASSSRLLLDASIAGRTPMLVNRVRYLIGLDACCDKARWWPVGLAAVVLVAGIWISMAGGGVGLEKARAGDAQVNDKSAVRRDVAHSGEFDAFLALSDEQKKTRLLAEVTARRKTCENLKATTTTSLKIVDMDPDTKAVRKLRQDLGREVHDLRRLGDSYRITLSRWRSGDAAAREVTTIRYDADSDVRRRCTDTTQGARSGRTYARIEKGPMILGDMCRFAHHLGGNFIEPSNDYLGLLLASAGTIEFGQPDRRNHTIEVRIHHKLFFSRETVECRLRLAPERQFMLVDLEWTKIDRGETDYYRSTVEQSKEVNGVWLPTRLRDIAWSSDSPVGAVGNVVDVTVQNVEVGTVTPEDVELPFAEGTYVTNQIDRSMYVVGPSDQRLLWPDAEWGPGSGPAGASDKKPAAKRRAEPVKPDDKPAAPEPQAAVSLADIIAKLRQNEKLYRDIDVTMRTIYKDKQEHGGALGNSGDAGGMSTAYTDRDHLVRYVHQGEKYRIEVVGTSKRADGSKSKENEIWSFDGRTTRTASSSRNGQTVDGRSEWALLFRPHAIFLRSFVSPNRDWLSSYLGQSGSQLVIAYQGDETVDGMKCHQVWITLTSAGGQPNSRLALWLAEERNYLPVKMASYTFRFSKDTPVAVGAVKQWRELKPGVWFPVETRVQRFDSFKIMREDKQEPTWSEDYFVQEVSLEPKHNADFFRDMAIPTGTKIDEVDATGEDGRSHRKATPKNPEAPAAKPVDVTVEQIRAAWEKRQKNVRSFQFVCEMTQTRMKGSSNYLREQPNTRYFGTTEDIPPEDVTVRRTITFSRSGERLAFAEEGKPWDIGLNGPVDGGHFECFDGKQLKWYSTTGGHLLGKIREGIGDSFVAYYFGIIPIWYAVSPVDRLAYDNDQLGAMAVQGRAVRDGRDCVRLSIPGQAKGHSTLMVVDPSRSFLPVEIVIEYNGGGKTHLTIDYVPDKQLDWSISGWEAAHFGDKPGQVATTQRGKVLRYSINKPLDKTIFQFDFPPGTEVTDFTGPQRRDFVVPEKRPAGPHANPSK